MSSTPTPKFPDPKKERKLELKLQEIRRRESGETTQLTEKASPPKVQFKETRLGELNLGQEKLNQFEKEVKNIQDLKTKIAQTQTTESLEFLLGGAISIEASDIHFEPEDKRIRLRFRIDGVLQDILDFPKNDYPALLNRIKLIAGLKINIREAPQDGRFTVKRSGGDIEVRVSSLPGAYGESIAMRLLDPKTIKKSLEELGIRSGLLEKIKKGLKKTTGLILTTGPTGSGKTTTLYAFINFANEPGVKIITIEDPIEYKIQGVSQTQVEPEKGYDFSNGLRSIVRQDPDVILVGEIRDAETAETALHAGLTGHLVFSTLHTNDAAGAIPRLIDMGVKPQIIAPAMNIAMAQRLVRKLCEDCKKEVSAEDAEIEKINSVLKNLDKNPVPKKHKFMIFKAAGCEKCNFTGYKSRIGIFEAFEMEPEIEKFILQTPNITEFKGLLDKKGMITMLQDGYLKVLEGITDLDEIHRVLGSS
ncbi:MAG: GspE/PulE family protein [Patescibacteria group bacterium]